MGFVVEGMLRDGLREEDVCSNTEVCCCRSRRLLLVLMVGLEGKGEGESLSKRGLSLRF